MIYADNAATTKMSDTAAHTMITLLEEAWGNPSSLYLHGQKAKEALEQAREEIAAVIQDALQRARGRSHPIRAGRLSEEDGKCHRVSEDPRRQIKGCKKKAY